MRYLSLILKITSILLMTSCATVPTVTSTYTPTVAATLQPPTTVSPALVGGATLEAGQSTHVFYHEGLEQVVLVNGGPEGGKPADEPLELWGWDGSQWSLLRADADGPTWRNWAAVAYDSARDVLVIHGGLQPGNHFDETWEWDGQTWARFEGTGPGGREGALLAYNVALDQMILFGGSTADMEIHGDSWMWKDQVWTKVSETGPAPRFAGGLFYDPARQEVLLYSGHFASPTGESIDYEDLWAWDGNSWREIYQGVPTPALRTHSGFVYDPVMEQVLLIGSGRDTFLSDVWAWDGTKWEEVPTSNTPARSGHNVAYDAKRDRFVLFGGVDRPGGRALDDTWEWDRENWICVSNCR